MKRGEVRWYTLKGPDKKRPVVILTRDSILEYLGEVTVVPVTSTIRNIPSEVLLSVQDGMNTDCAILIVTIYKQCQKLTRIGSGQDITLK